MRILVTGGSGFIGRALCSFLLKKDHELVLLSRNPKKTLQFLKKDLSSYQTHKIQVYPWDMEKSPPHIELLRNLDSVIHLAGAPIAEKRWNKEWKERIYKTRIDGTKNLILGLEKAKPSLTTFISASAVGFYGYSKKDEILTETSLPNKRENDFLSHLCVLWEDEVKKAFQEFSSPPRKVILRISNVLGKEGGILKKLKNPFRLGLGASLGLGQQYMSWIHIEDLIRLISFSLENETIEGPINASSPFPVKNLDFTKILSSVFHRKAFLRIPSFVLFVLAGEIAKYVLSSLYVVSEKLEKCEFHFKYPLLEEALKKIYENKLQKD